MVNRQLLAVLIIVVLVLPAYADRGNDAYKHGAQAERQSNYDAAFTYYKQAYTLTPNNTKYLAKYTRMRFTAASQHVHAGQSLRNTGALAEALKEFQRAVEIDTSSFIAQQELRSRPTLSGGRNGRRRQRPRCRHPRRLKRLPSRWNCSPSLPPPSPCT